MVTVIAPGTLPARRSLSKLTRITSVGPVTGTTETHLRADRLVGELAGRQRADHVAAPILGRQRQRLVGEGGGGCDADGSTISRAVAATVPSTLATALIT